MNSYKLLAPSSLCHRKTTSYIVQAKGSDTKAKAARPRNHMVGTFTQNSSLEGAGGASDQQPWHSMSVDDVISYVGSSPDGLTNLQAEERRQHYGPNIIPPAKGDTVFDLIWRQINNPLIWVLIVSAGVAMLADPTGGVKNGLVILAVVVLNTIIGFVQEYKAGKAIEALTRLVPESVTVLRGGNKLTRPAADLVPGDIVLLASGDKVPADMRLIQHRGLQVEEAALTGESMPVHKKLEPVAPAASIGDRTCMVFAGTLVTYGTGTAVVVETGTRTQLGRISDLLKETTDLKTPLTKDLENIGRYITFAIVIIALVMLMVGTWRTMSGIQVGWLPALRETVIFAVALAVGAIPEGLPAIMTIALAIGVQRMAARRAVVRKLPAVETLGSTTVICTDKTGTLTRNEMTVQELWTPPSGAFKVTGVGYRPEGKLLRKGGPVASEALSVPEAPSVPEDVSELLLAGVLCNDASLTCEDGQWKVHGDPTEGALIVVAEKIGLVAAQVKSRFKRLDAIPFESENQFMATLHAHHDGERIVIKGAPEVVLGRCADETGATFDQADVLGEVDALAAQGMRVLAFAVKPALGFSRIEMHDTEEGFTFLGLQGMIDPPRPEAIDAIKLCHQAGITVKMITGDHRGTAQAIAAQIGILPVDPDAPKVITGAQLAAMPDAQMREVASACNVFARVAPEHKLRLVNALQSLNEVVAMTGDGVNDAPALKQANIGVAMGITGTSVSKEAAGIVLTDDNFASIAAAVEEGRRVYDNLIKSLAFVLPTNLGLALILMWAVAFFPFAETAYVVNGMSLAVRELLLPMSPAQLLWINLVAAVALALPLAFEAKEPDIMNRPPRNPGTPVLSRFVITRTILVAIIMTAGAIALFLHEFHAAKGSGPQALANAQTMAVTTVIMFQIFYLMNCRSLRDSVLKIGVFSNKAVFIGIAAVLALQATFVYAPFMQAIFGSASLALEDVLKSVAVGAIILPVISLEKWLRWRVARA